ncbi:MAG: choice-of-anchor Q domain-containing protein [Phycisphaerales bacterium]
MQSLIHPEASRASSRTATIIALAAGSAFSSIASAATINVPGDAPNIAAAIGLANDGDEIVVADGNWAAPLSINGIDLLLRSASGDPAACTIGSAAGTALVITGASADVVVRDIGFQQVGRLIEANGVDRLILEGCHFSGTQLAAVVFGGNVLRADDCRFEGNSFPTGPGAAILALGGNVRITRSSFINNEVDGALGDGGALAMMAGDLVVVDSVFTGNVAASTVDGDGGAIYVGPAVASARIASTLLADNDAGRRGGGLSAEIDNVELSNVVIRNNSADAGGGVYFQAPLESCGTTRIAGAVIDLNESNSGGGAIRLGSGANLEMVNATVVFNVAGTGGGGLHVTSDAELDLANSIVGSNIGDEIGGTGTAAVQHSNVQGGWPGPGNIGGLPQFVNAASLDYRLAADSPCIDAGSSAVALAPSTDIIGRVRSVDDPATVDTGIASLLRVIDMGAFEFQPVDVEPVCPTDVDGSGETDFGDLLSVLSAWGACS